MYHKLHEDHVLFNSHNRIENKRGRRRRHRGEYIPVPTTYYDLPIRTRSPPVFYPLPAYSMFSGYDLESHLPHLPYSPASYLVGGVGKCKRDWCSVGYVTGKDGKVFQLYAQKSINQYLDRSNNYFNYKVIDNNKVEILLDLPTGKILKTNDKVEIGGYKDSGPFTVTINDTGTGFVYIPV